MKRKGPRGFPKGTKVEFIRPGKKEGGIMIPYKYKSPHITKRMIGQGTVPIKGTHGEVVARSRVAGYYIVKFANMQHHVEQYGETNRLAIHKSHFKRVPAKNPMVDYRVAKKNEEGAIQIGRVWIIGENAE